VTTPSPPRQATAARSSGISTTARKPVSFRSRSNLGRAQRRLEEGGSSDEASELVRSAHEEAKQALAEIRDLARGIHPAVLTDRGLDAALSSLAARSAVPVSLRSEIGSERPPEQVESAA
jgi:signal transduction histidine kinase